MRTAVEAAVIQALGGAEALVGAIVKEALTAKTKDHSSGFYARDVPYLELVCRDVIQGTVRETVKKYFDGKKEEIAVEVQKQLANMGPDVASKIVEAVFKASDYDYKIAVNVDVKSKERDDD